MCKIATKPHTKPKSKKRKNVVKKYKNFANALFF